MKKIKQFSLLLIAFLLLPGVSILAEDPELEFSWPMEIESDEGYVTTLYQPQLESFEADILEGRMAVTIKAPEKEMIFGSLWFKARLSTDMENRTVLLEKMDIIKTHFPDIVDEEKTSSFTKLLAAEIESWNLEMDLDRILASMSEVENLKILSDDINNDPPSIYFRTTPAVLLMIDGEPILKEDEDAKLEYVVNTPFFMVKDPKKDKYYVKGGPFWYVSTDMITGWEETSKVPSKIKKFAEENAEAGEEQDSIAQSYSEAPELIVDTRAAELVMVDGEPDYKAIEGTSLLFVSNSESDIIMDINSQNHYLLLAGRWYHSKSLQDGDWKFSEPEDLPEDFQNIPDESEMAQVRPSIPGTPEAQTALLEQSIPQTATIDRAEATTSVTYDGNPQFEQIEGTSVAYAVNTDMTVLLINNVYYVVDDAVWFMSDKPDGPWEVCVVRPAEVDEIPPEAPVYNVKYTYIYDSTPEVVYVGYLPGYTYSYVYGGVVVYGTGYYYYPWYGYYYYPRPVTWGYGVHYYPYYGWGFSYGISYGWIGWRYHPYSRAYWGARGYRHGYRHGYARGYRHGARHGARAGYRAGYRAGQRNSHHNVYNNRSNGVKQSPNRNPGTNNVNNKARPSTQPNNMYSDRNGNVYERNQNGNFDQKSNRAGQQGGQQPGQQPSTGQQPSQRPSQQPSTGQQPSQQPSTGQQPSQRPSTTQPSTGQQQRQAQPSQNNRSMEQSYQNRSQGSQNYNRSQQQRSSSPSRSGGGASRGGGGRR